MLLVPKPRPSSQQRRRDHSLLWREMPPRWMRAPEHLTRQARRFPTGGGFISRCRISDCWHLQSTQRWPFKRVRGSLQSATCGGGSSGCGRERTTPRPDHGSKVLTARCVSIWLISVRKGAIIFSVRRSVAQSHRLRGRTLASASTAGLADDRGCRLGSMHGVCACASEMRVVEVLPAP